MLRWQHGHQGSTVPEHQHVSPLQEDAKIGATSIHVADHRLQRGRQLAPVTGGQHPGKGAQGVAEEPGWQRRIQAPVVGAFRFALTAGQVMTPTPVEELPAVLHQLQPRQQRRKRGVQRPRHGIGGELVQSKTALAAYCRRRHPAVRQSSPKQVGLVTPALAGLPPEWTRPWFW